MVDSLFLGSSKKISCSNSWLLSLVNLLIAVYLYLFWNRVIHGGLGEIRSSELSSCLNLGVRPNPPGLFSFRG